MNLLFILRIKIILTKNNKKIFSWRNDSPNCWFSVSMVTRLAPNLYDVTKAFYQQAHYGVLLPLGNWNVSQFRSLSWQLSSRQTERSPGRIDTPERARNQTVAVAIARLSPDYLMDRAAWHASVISDRNGAFNWRASGKLGWKAARKKSSNKKPSYMQKKSTN